MKKILFVIAIIACALSVSAQDSLYVNKKDGSIIAYKISDVDSISFTRKPASTSGTINGQAYVVINGVKWATCNVNTPGTFASAPEASGMFYQWNSKTAWPATGSVTGWNSSWNGGYTSPSSSDTWTSANDPSPAGWRVPTYAEIDSLVGSKNVSCTWTIQSGVKFTDKTTGNTLFLPASGFRGNGGGTLLYVGSVGNYWSSTAYNSSDAYGLSFGNSSANWDSSNRAYGLSVRSVAE